MCVKALDSELALNFSRFQFVCLVTQLCPTLCDPMDCSPPGSAVHGDSLGKKTGVGFHSLLQGNLPNPGIKPRSPPVAGGFFTIRATREA